MYLLMNKNKIIGDFSVNHGEISDTFSFNAYKNTYLPVGFKYIDAWIENRKASKHNAHLRKLMEECGCNSIEGFIKIIHAASINDTFWIKEENENITWEKVSFYQNKFDETISRLAFEGLGLYGIKLSSTSPELSTNGSFRKCWLRENNGDIFLYKRGSNGARNAGIEPYCEIMASEIAVKLLKNDAVSYDLVKLHGETASKCQLFTNEDYGYVPISKFNINYSSPNALIGFFSKLGSENVFRKMLVLDSLTFNIDRHADNYGVLVENDTQKPVRMAPIFDLNLSMLPYIEKEDWAKIGNKLEEYAPKIGEDFTRMGQLAINSEIRAALINLKGFEFSFRGDDKFPEERVKFMEKLVNKQIEALLSKEILFTKDIFVPEKEINKEEDILTENDELADKIWTEHNLSTFFSVYDITNKKNPCMILYLQNEPNKEIHLNLENGSILAYRDGYKINLQENKDINALVELINIAYNEETELIRGDDIER